MNLYKEENKMKKFFKLFIIIFIVSVNFFNVNALDTQSLLIDYQNIIDEINEEYQTHLYILSETEFIQSPIYNDYDNNYSNYINNILQTDIDTFKSDCLKIINVQTIYDYQINHMTRSTLGKKTMSFNNNCNSMTLTYKHNGSKFDTSYKPTATVAKLANSNYFVMSSYTGTFKNSNATYTVSAKGKIYSRYGTASNKTFVVNFNL